VTEPGETTGIRFLLDRGGTISGTVVDQEGHPVMGAWVQANTQVPWDSVYGKPEPIGSGSGFGYGYSDENGAYRITGLEKGEYLVSAQAWNGWITETQWYNGSVLPDQATPVSVEPGEEVSGIDFRFSFPQGVGSVSGTVLDEKGVPVPNASVQVYTDFSAATGFSFWAYGYTDVEGRYRVDNIPEGTYIVSCWAQVGWQYAFRYWPDSETQEGAQKVTVDGNTENDRTDFRLPISAGASLVEGTVRSTTGRLLTNAFVQVVSKTEIPDEPARTLWAYGNTDSSGHYRVEYLPAGTYTVQCTYWEGISMGQGWYNQADAESLATPLVLGDREKRSGVDFNLNVRPMYGTIAGTVTDASTGLPIPKAYVEIEPVSVSGFRDRCWWGWWKNTAFTDEKGRFSVEWMWEGKYRIAAYADGAFAYYPNAPVPDLSEPVTVTGGETATADFALRRRNEGPCVIRGMITSEFGYWRNWGVDDTMIGPAPGLPETKPGKAVRIQKVLDASPLEGAVVVAKPAVTVQTWPESERFYNTLSRSDGSYELKGLPEGEYYVMAFGSTYMPAYYKDTFDPAKAVLVRVGEAEPAEAIDIALPPMIFMYWNADTEGGGRKDFSGGNGASVRGMVTDSSGKPVAGAVVYLLNTEGQAMASVTTNAEGAYEIAGMSAGNYVIQASKLGYATTFNGIAPSLESADPLFVGNGTLEMNFSLKGSSGIQPNPTTPSRVSLYANYPNPFNPVTSIRFALPAAAAVRLTVFDLNGRELKTLWNGPASEGFHQVTWNATDASGNAVPSGMYLYRLETPKSVKSGKMIYLR
jgi:protocatechuate 3,4-dioxygenase beta subunit